MTVSFKCVRSSERRLLWAIRLVLRKTVTENRTVVSAASSTVQRTARHVKPNCITPVLCTRANVLAPVHDACNALVRGFCLHRLLFRGSQGAFSSQRPPENGFGSGIEERFV